MKKTILYLLGVICFVPIVHAQVNSSPQGAEPSSGIYIKVGQASLKKSLLAFPPFQILNQTTAQSRSVNVELFNTIYNDLTVSNYFQFVAPAAFLEDPSKVGLTPAPGSPTGFHFASWQQIGADFLIRCGVEVTGGKVQFTAYVYYVPQAKLVFGKKYSSAIKDVRLLAHTFTNDVLANLTGQNGFFLTKFVVVSDYFDRYKPIGRRAKEIYIMDWDGRNAKRVSFHHSIALSPAWSPDGKAIAYTAYAYHVKARTRNPDLFYYDLTTGKRRLLSFFKGINSGAAFIPHSDDLLMSRDANPDIFEINRRGRTINQLTRGPADSMNVEAAPSPDGSQVAFSSDRGGKPMIYTMDSDGSHVHRRTFAGNYNSSPTWSPDGKKIAFAGYPDHASHFDIYIMNEDGTDLQRLTSASRPDGQPANNEDPSFSPDGRRIVFISDRSGHNQIYIIQPDGQDERRITNDAANYYKPKWSP